uniref:uncharacterized protein LOC120330911 n=1 Tax=Styela clava TaxID=7725 RepID=UPI001939501B|nr:uncharacterized protein LOC120330911 [Styela clava]
MNIAWKIVILVCFCGGIEIEGAVCKGGDTDQCTCDLADGSGAIDISFGNQDNTALYHGVTGQDFTYDYNPCYPFDNDTLTGLAMLQYDDGGDYYDVGQQKGATWKKDDSGSLVIVYTSADGYDTSTVKLICDKGTSTNQLTAQGPDATFYNYNFQFSGPALCPVRNGGGGLSGGSIFLIIVFVVLFMYLVCGIIYKKTRTDATGSDLIPNKDFRSSIPGLIKDGVMFLVYKCKGTEKPDYDNI